LTVLLDPAVEAVAVVLAVQAVPVSAVEAEMVVVVLLMAHLLMLIQVAVVEDRFQAVTLDRSLVVTVARA
jgi:hypothetical protein